MKGLRENPQTQGFALIVVISMVVLMALLAVGLMGLATVGLRSSSRMLAHHEAESNARMALNLALGQLQKELGPDQAVSGEAGILDSSPVTETVDGVAEPRWTGRWRSGGEGAPDPKVIGQQEEIRKWSEGEGVKWLVSGTDPDPEKGPAADKALTIARVADAEGKLHPVKVERVDVGEGGYAYWVGDLGTKARVDLKDELAEVDPGSDVGEGLRRFAVPGRNEIEGTDSFLTELEEGTLDREASWEGVVDAEQLELACRKSGLKWEVDSSLWDDFAVGTKGVLADVRQGGLRIDLTAAFEDGESYEELVERFSFGRIIQGKAASGGAIYGPRWDHLYAYYQQYRPFQELVFDGKKYVKQSSGATFRAIDRLGGDEVPALHPHAANYGPTNWTYSGKDGAFTYWSSWNREDNPRVQMAPIIVGFHWHFGVSAKPTAGEEGKYDFNLHVFPALVMWNPYNVEITNHRPGFQTNISYVNHDNRIRIEVGDESGGTVLVENLFEDLVNGYRGMWTRDSVAFAPGEVRVFGAEEAGMEVGSVKEIYLGNDYDPTADMVFPMRKGVTVGDPSSSRVRVTVSGKQVRANVFSYDIETSGRASWINYNDYNRTNHGGTVGSALKYDSGTTDGAPFDLAFVDQLFDPAGDHLLPEKFYHMRGVVRTTVPEMDHNATAIFHDFTPIRRVPTANFDMHILASVFRGNLAEYDVEVVPGELDPLGGEGTIHRGYFGTTNRSSVAGSGAAVRGLTRFVVKDVPRQPMLSLGDFMHMNLALDPAMPFFPVGGSYVSPFVASDSVVGSVGYHESNFENRKSGHRVDAGYLLNEALFDSYFFSGIPSEWRESKQSLSGLAGSHGFPRPVRPNGQGVFGAGAYDGKAHLHPVGESFDGNYLELGSANPRMSYHGSPELEELRDMDEVSSNLMLDGAFNVNSTSVEAWKALLGSHGGKEMRVWDLVNGRKDTVKGNTGDFPIPRFSVPMSVESSSGASDAQNHPWGGLRSLSEGELETLAEEVVKQVKRRGPFLSMGDFVNRRLEGGELGRMGALQAAIDATSINDKAMAEGVGGAEYDFNRDGTEDWSVTTGVPGTAAGIPGYLLQNDLLRNFGAVLSSRSDSFVVRAYGESRRGDVVEARAMCEAVVQRVPEYLDDSVEPWERLDGDDQTEVNRRFGRRFEVVSFRWLSKSEYSG